MILDSLTLGDLDPNETDGPWTPMIVWALDPCETGGSWPWPLWYCGFDPYYVVGPGPPMRRVSWTPLMLCSLSPYETGAPWTQDGKPCDVEPRSSHFSSSLLFKQATWKVNSWKWIAVNSLQLRSFWQFHNSNIKWSI